MTVFRTQWFENIFVRSFKIYREDDKTDKAFKMRPVIDNLNSKFFEVLSNDSEQSIDKQMVSFKGRFGMKQYTKSKPIKWGFKFWFRCLSKSGYLYQIYVYLGRKQTPSFNLGLRGRSSSPVDERRLAIVLHCLFWQLFLIVLKNIYGVGTVWASRKQMPKMMDDKQMTRGNCKLLFSGNTMAWKWMDD